MGLRGAEVNSFVCLYVLDKNQPWARHGHEKIQNKKSALETQRLCFCLSKTLNGKLIFKKYLSFSSSCCDKIRILSTTIQP